MEYANKNALFETLAKQYVEVYGEKLKLEALELEQQNIERITPKLDKKVRKIGRSGRRRYAAGFVAMAAGMLLVLMLPGLLDINNQRMTAPSFPAFETSASQAGPSSAKAPEATPPAESAEPGRPPEPELLPINFTMPANFTVSGMELDNGKSIYYLSDSNFDDVVMTMEIDPLEDIFAELKPITISDSRAYYKYLPDFSVLAFERGSVTYVLTCKHDVNTLIPLGEAILKI